MPFFFYYPNILKLKLYLVSLLIIVAAISIPIISLPGDNFFGLNLKLLGSLIFFLGIPLFWNLRNKEVSKFPDSMLDIDD